MSIEQKIEWIFTVILGFPMALIILIICLHFIKDLLKFAWFIFKELINKV